MFGTAFYHGMEAVVINTAALLVTLIGFGVFVALFGFDPFDVYYIHNPDNYYR